MRAERPGEPKLKKKNPLHTDGWPHLNAYGNCLCVQPCCFGSRGCCCRSCSQESHIHFAKEEAIRRWCKQNHIEIPGWEENIPADIIAQYIQMHKEGGE